MNAQTKLIPLEWETIQELVRAMAKDSKYARFCEMLAGYFRQESEDKTWSRRPPLGFRLTHGDYLFTIRPGIHQRQQISVIPDSLLIEGLRVEEGNLKKKWKVVGLRNNAADPSDKNNRVTRWSHEWGLDAVENLIEMANFFVTVGPETVFRKSENNCCVCGKVLTDSLSRNRGIGPECLDRVTQCFGTLFKEGE